MKVDIYLNKEQKFQVAQELDLTTLIRLSMVKAFDEGNNNCAQKLASIYAELEISKQN